MTTAAETKPLIDFVPEENLEATRRDIAAWIQANGFMGMTPSTLLSLENGSVSSLEFGGIVTTSAGDRIQAHATLYVDVWPSFKYEVVEDAQGTWWARNRIAVTVIAPGYGSASVASARPRAQIFSAVIELAERLQAEFGDRAVWCVRSTRAGREAAAASNRKAAMRDLVAGAVALECSGMRVGSMRSARTPQDVEPGKYEVVRAGKTYRAVVRKNASAFNFSRVT